MSRFAGVPTRWRDKARTDPVEQFKHELRLSQYLKPSDRNHVLRWTAYIESKCNKDLASRAFVRAAAVAYAAQTQIIARLLSNDRPKRASHTDPIANLMARYNDIITRSLRLAGIKGGEVKRNGKKVKTSIFSAPGANEDNPEGAAQGVTGEAA